MFDLFCFCLCGEKLYVLALIGNGGIEPYKAVILDWSWKWMIPSNKRGTIVETDLVKI